MANEDAKNNFQIIENRWLEDEEMYSSTMTIDIDEEFMQSIYKAIEALKKQIPKKPKFYNVGVWRYPECPNGCVEFGYNRPNYCEKCGQKIDWSELEEE